jgi:hypothetical protein
MRVRKSIADVLPPPEAIVPPTYWTNKGLTFHDTPSVPSDVREAIQEMLNVTYKKVTTSDRKGAKMANSLRVTSIKRIENSELWKTYANRVYNTGLQRKHVSWIAKISTAGDVVTRAPGSKLPGALKKEINEVYLWHGTSPHGASGISKTGFKLSLSGDNAGSMFGKGIYLAEHSSKSDEYATDGTDEVYKHQFCLLLCRVVVGEMFHIMQGGSTIHDVIDAAMRSGTFDAVLGDRQASVGTYREFVVFREDQVYPEYMVLYEREFD